MTKFLSPLQEKIRSHLALLYDPETCETGSGVLIKIKNKVFILTAAHVISENIKINLGLPWQRLSFSILNCWRDESLDISFLELNPFEVEILRVDEVATYNIAAKISTEIKHGIPAFAICGYPTVLQRAVNENSTKCTPVFLGCKIVMPEHWPTFLNERGKSSQNNIALAYGGKFGGAFFDPKGKQLEFISPKGLSGCGIWYYDPEKKDAEIPLYGLVAIQHSFFPQNHLIVGSFVKPIIRAICTRYGFSL